MALSNRNGSHDFASASLKTLENEGGLSLSRKVAEATLCCSSPEHQHSKSSETRVYVCRESGDPRNAYSKASRVDKNRIQVVHARATLQPGSSDRECED
jgi:hypothetical protein